jgi:CubicO group peptidase (beta-lactamase class C family)
MRKSLFILIGLFLNGLAAQEGTTKKLEGFSNTELSYASPSEVGLDSLYIHTKVDSIITNGIKQKAFPGAQILVAKNGKIVFHEAYGFHTYDSIQPVSLDDMYDLASVTKIMGPLPAIMKLVDENKLDLDTPFSTYWKPWRHSKYKSKLTLRQILAHQAGLVPYIVFLNKVLKKNGRSKNRFVRKVQTPRFGKEAYPGLFVKTRFNHKMYRIINRSDVSLERKYKYSGLAFLIFPKLIEQLTGQSYQTYLTSNFYGPLGATTLTYLPSLKNYSNKIVPTEVDTIFRHTLTQGWVHDENAALMGGVSGNAGLFATATDLAKMMQLYLNYGAYGGRRYISEKTLKEFTRVQYPGNGNRRGLGFDKPELNNEELSLKDAYPAPETSPDSFGHSGFTGTFVWADPTNQLVYIFLSNRVNPTRDHGNIYKLNIRPAVQQVFYQAIIKE